MKNNPFKAVDWMRKCREKVDEADRGLSWEEKYLKTLKLIENDRLWLKLKDRAVKPNSSLSIALRESKAKYGSK